MEHEELGMWLQCQREVRCWTRREMARQLIRAAGAAGDRSITGIGNLCHNIYRWEKGTVSPGERYRLYYCSAFGIPPFAFGGGDPAGTAALVLPGECDGETVRLLNLVDIERGVTLRTEAASAAARIARELSEGMTQAGRVATHQFLTEIAEAVRWPKAQDRQPL